MATVTYCDGCGEKVDKVVKVHLKAEGLSRGNSLTDAMYNRSGIDLCDSCFDLLRKFVSRYGDKTKTEAKETRDKLRDIQARVISELHTKSRTDPVLTQ